MFLPTGDTPNPRDFKPWVNWTLIGINIAVFLIVTLPLGNRPVSVNDPALREYIEAISPALPANVSPTQFLHSLRAYLIIDNIFPFLFDAQSSVAHGAHIGGFLAGLSVAAAGERLAWQWPWTGRLQPAASDSPPTTRTDQLKAAIHQQDPGRSLHFTAQANNQDLADVYLELALLRLRQGQVTSAYQHLLDALDHSPAPSTQRRIQDALQKIEGPRR